MTHVNQDALERLILQSLMGEEGIDYENIKRHHPGLGVWAINCYPLQSDAMRKRIEGIKELEFVREMPRSGSTGLKFEVRFRVPPRILYGGEPE